MNFATDKKYIINLKRRIDRRMHIINEMQKFSFSNYEIVEAIDGDTLDYESKPTKFLPNGLSRYQVACLRTHLQIIKSAKEQKLPYVTIIEDDAIFSTQFHKRYKQIMDEQFDYFWHLFYLGCNNIFKPTMIEANIGKCVYSLTTVCYVASEKIYDTIIYALEKEDMPVDMILAENVQPNVKAFCVYPPLVKQLQGYSDIEQKEVNYEKYYKV